MMDESTMIPQHDLHGATDANDTVQKARSRHNNLAPISRLHPEILEKIFCIYAIMEAAEGSPHKCFLVTYICQRWRNLALQLSQMWIHIYTFSFYISRAMLERSKPSPFIINTSWGHDYIKVALQQSHNLKEIRLADVSYLLIEGLATLIKGPTPHLEICTLEDKDAQGSLVPVQLSPSPTTTPRLKTLHLRGYCLRWGAPLPHTLTRLKIFDIPEFSRPTQIELLGALEHVPLLVELVLCKCLPKGEASGFIGHCNVVEFSHLRRLELEGSPLECAQGLDHIQFPSNTHLVLSVPGEANTTNFPRLVAGIERHLASSSVGTLDLFHTLRRVERELDGVCLAVFDSGGLAKSRGCLLSLHIVFGPTADGYLYEEFPTLPMEELISQELLGAVLRGINLSDLDELRISQKLLPTVSEDLVSDILRRANVQTLYVSGVPPTRILSTLLNSVENKAEQSDSARSSIGENSTAHSLHNLTFLGTNFVEWTDINLLGALQQRCKSGRAISKLTIRHCTLDTAIISQLATAVGLLDWDGIHSANKPERHWLWDSEIVFDDLEESEEFEWD